MKLTIMSFINSPYLHNKPSDMFPIGLKNSLLLSIEKFFLTETLISPSPFIISKQMRKIFKAIRN